ncbi:hypothetical protein CALVIDRAFT_397707 [Calocera viscosa TUFC12733]|uniref:Proteophosphoglycan ppg4 n=1 Tax=Calocera viscosa (strain TUFC12733) TaxID=1330018 RepID=A0A167PRV6_CALVF|nr:hypothetical protein CALVIDRAFT_397707 [Calocera viscosa TUFC12733]
MRASASRSSIGAGVRAYSPCRNALQLLSLALAASAGPTPTRRALGTDTPQSSDNTNSVAQTWIPVALVIVLVMGLFALTWTQRGRQFIARLRNREGTGAAAATTTPAPTTRAVRPRRRRRASQISTKSLPAYMEEPGDEELVLVRRTAAAESQTSGSPSDMPADAVTLSEDAPTYDGPAALAPAHLRSLSIGESIGNHSMDTGNIGSDESSTSLMRAERRASVRSAAPSYSAVIGQEEATRISMDLQRLQTRTSSEPEEPHPTEEERNATVTQRPGERRRSGFFNLFSHSRQSSAANGAETGTGTARNSTIRQNGDGDRTSWFNLGPLNRQSALLTPSTTPRPAAPASSLASASTHNASQTQLTSPSMTSLTSATISAPLTHTATRVSFDYPRTGPTPQQVAFLASRESLARFGVPFGADAQAAAAAGAETASLPPPPSFDDSENDDARSGRSRSSSDGRRSGESGRGPEMGSLPEGAEEGANQGTIRARNRQSPTLDTTPTGPSLTPPATEIDTPHVEAPPALPAARGRLPLSIPLPPADDDLPALSIIPATPLSSAPPTPAGSTPPPRVIASAAP